MSFKSKALAGAAALSVIAGGLGVAATAAHASTPQCGSGCITLQNNGSGGVLDVYKQVKKLGQPVIEWGQSNYDPAQDFTVAREGSVNDFVRAGLASKALAIHYGHYQAYEIQYSPYGVDSGLCLGVAKTAYDGEATTLRDCGVSSRTLWVVDGPDAIWKNGHLASFPLINGSNTNFSQPFVLTDNSGKLVLRHINKSDGVVNPNKEWSLAG